MGPSWGYLGPFSRPKNSDFPLVFLTFYDICASSTILTRSCFIFRDLKPIFSDLKPFFGELEAIWSHLGPSEANLKPSWGHLGPILGPSWAYLGLSSRHKNIDFPMVFLAFSDIRASSTISTRSYYDLKPICLDLALPPFLRSSKT